MGKKRGKTSFLSLSLSAKCGGGERGNFWSFFFSFCFLFLLFLLVEGWEILSLCLRPLPPLLCLRSRNSIVSGGRPRRITRTDPECKDVQRLFLSLFRKMYSSALQFSLFASSTRGGTTMNYSTIWTTPRGSLLFCCIFGRQNFSGSELTLKLSTGTGLFLLP